MCSAGVRTLPLPTSAVEALRVHRAAQQAERAAADEWDDSCGVVIATRNGRPVNHGTPGARGIASSNTREWSTGVSTTCAMPG